MKSDLPKVVHTIEGKCLVDYAIEAAQGAGATDICLVLGYKYEVVHEKIEHKDVKFGLQEQQLGTGHAVLCAKDFLGEEGQTMILFGDTPLITAETLSGIPSIVYGLFGMLFFTKTLKMGYSMMSGACTLAIMILPLIMRTAEEALKSVPDSYREASFGLGAGKLRTIFKIVLPSAVPGILSGVILATGRVVGETAALLFTAGTIAKVAGLMDSGRTLAVHMYALSSEGLYMNQMYATGVILMLIVLLINGCSGMIAKKIAKK